MKRLTTVAAAFVMVAVAMASAARYCDGQESKRAEDGISGEKSGDQQTIEFAGEKLQLGEYWLGLEVARPSDELRKKLDLGQDQGVMVQQVVPDSPAAKAGLKPGDVLVGANGKPLKSLKDAIDAIQEAKENDLALEFLRYDRGRANGGRITVKPTKRPSGFGFFGPESGKEAAEPGAALAKNPAAEKELRIARSRLAEAINKASDLGRIRAELQEVQQRIGMINRQLGELEASRPNPDREKLIRQMAAMKRAAAELAEVGRTEDADRLKNQLHELGERLKSLDQRNEDTSIRGSMFVPGPIMPSPGMPGAGLSGATLTAPATMLSLTTGAPPGVAVTERRIEQPGSLIGFGGAPITPEPALAAVAELRQQVEEMRRELHELRETIAKSRKE